MNAYAHTDHAQVISETKATATGAFLCMEADRAAVRVTGRDTLDLLNRLTTMKVDDLSVGSVRETLLTNEKGRVIDAALVAVPGADTPSGDTSGGDTSGADVLLLLSPGMAEEVIAWLEKYTIMEDCVYEDISASLTQFSIYNIGAGAPGDVIPVPVAGSAAVFPLGESTVRVLHHRSVTGAGLRLLCAPEDARAVREYLVDHARIPLVGPEAFTLWRIDRLLPAVGHELSALTNPLEAGAAAAVDFEKGCYIGQEVIARLDSYDKVQRRPCRIRRTSFTDEYPLPGSVLYAGEKNAGFVTTLASDPRTGNDIGIALVRHAFAGGGTELSLRSGGDARPFTVENTA
ncbi:MAG: hypothetical protein RRA94_08740 [Bacteroidota bacterium]|nr:hypothetical protein [Bacteroidota bacterium]